MTPMHKMTTFIRSVSVLMIVIIVTAAVGISAPEPVYALDNGLARTPPMGWNPWQRFQCKIDEKLIKQQVDALVKQGLAGVGYKYVIVDDCWMMGNRDPEGRMIADYIRFPNGMKVIGDYIHGKGLKFGLYASRGILTCSAKMGSQEHEDIDARSFAEWGVDYVKYDNCPLIGSEEEIQRRYTNMANAIKKAGRPMIFSMAAYNFREWMPGIGHLGRTYGDISDDWGAMLRNFDENAGYARFQRPGYWNDPDMLEVGNGKMTPTEYKTMFTLWAISGAPLIMSSDLITIAKENLAILKNTQVIAVDQDSAGVQGVKIADSGNGLQVWSKRLAAKGSYAVVLLNRTDSEQTISVNWKDVDSTITRAQVSDLWSGGGGTYSTTFSAKVLPHGVVMIRIKRVG